MLPGVNALSVIKVETDIALVGITPLTAAPVITAPTENEVIKVGWDQNVFIVNIPLAWSAAAGAASYEIEISTDNKFPIGETRLIEEPGTSYNILAYLTAVNSDMFIRVRGVDVFSAGPWSEGLSFSVAKETIKDGLERLKLPTNSGTETQFIQSVNDPEAGKKSVTMKSLMKMKVPVNASDEPTGDLAAFVKNGDIWYDET